MTRPVASANSAISCTQLITRFDRNNERPITLELLRRVRRGIRRRMVAAGAHGSMVWRLARTPAGITVAAFWHPRRDMKVSLAHPIRGQRLERRRTAERTGVTNRRRLGSRPSPRPAATFS